MREAEGVVEREGMERWVKEELRDEEVGRGPRRQGRLEGQSVLARHWLRSRIVIS